MYVKITGINKRFGDFPAVQDATFTIRRGALAALLGPSGSGKTTLLRMIAGLEHPDSGDIVVDDRRLNDIAPSQRGVGFVFQHYALFRYMTVFDNIAFGLKVKKMPRAAIRQRVEELLTLVGMAGLAKRYPAQLSGGQRQRVAFARAIAPSPHLLLLDEPFAAIDAKVRRELRVWLRDMVGKLNLTSIFVTHDQDEAIEVADEIIVTNQGRVEQRGAPVELYRAPATPFVTGFIGDSIQLDNCQLIKGFEELGPVPGAVRPEFIGVFHPEAEIPYANSAIDAKVVRLAFRGDTFEVGLDLRGCPLTARYALDSRPIAVGEIVKVLVWRLYAFTGERVALVNNNCTGDHPQGYSYVI
ncbi:MAG: sulfate ABC transporter ATP-binding protein [Planctomycetota bacterium]|jgi:sulfate transport system ATP-binding protein|nr:sulfate ABC transporter ATP-binding protein [Planctomycetota bacterium]